MKCQLCATKGEKVVIKTATTLQRATLCNDHIDFLWRVKRHVVGIEEIRPEDEHDTEIRDRS